MKKILFIISALLVCSQVFAQNGGGGGANRNRGGSTQQQKAAVLPPLPFREVSGVVRDSSDNAIIGATVLLTSKLDTLRTSTNADGVFVLRNVKLATFTTTINSMGYVTKVNKYLQNDAVKKLILDPIIMIENNKMLKTVTINGVPSITYKTDTVEYRASDYKVRENSTVDELLKKMEGMEVGSDGSLTHQGQQVTKAKLNGKAFGDGDVATAIKNLPADIVEKIQIVDDYGDAAARTGIKDGDPQKILNITTRADRSIGLTGRFTGQYGSDDRYNANLSVQRINANQQFNFIGNLRNSQNGVASSGIAGGATNGGGGGTGVGAGAGRGSSPGTTQSGYPSLSYRDQWGKKIQVNTNYAYRFSNTNATSISNGLRKTTYGPNIFSKNGSSDNNNRSHNFSFDIEYSIDSANFLKFTPTFSYSGSNASTDNITDNLQYYTQVVPGYPPPPGFSHPVVNSMSDNVNNAPNYGGLLFYQHIFKKQGRNASVQFSLNKSTTEANRESNNDTHYYQDSTRDYVLKDSISHLITKRTSANTTSRVSVTYSEPIGKLSRIDFNGQTRRSVYDNKAAVDTVLANGSTLEVASRSNNYNYSFTETRLTLDYRFTGVKYNISVGLTAVPTLLEGVKVNTSNVNNLPVTRSDFRLIPVFRLAYSWSRTERFSFAYSGSNAEPSFQEIQPFTDATDPNNIIVGNPNLKPSFTHSLSAGYNNYIANSKLNFSVNFNASFVNNQIAQNSILLFRTVMENGKPVNINFNQTNYININGTHSYVARYNVAKQLDDRKYNLSLNGNVTYGYNVGMSQGQEYHSTTWRFDERFGPRISPNDNIEINPYIGYDLSRSFNSLPTSGANSSRGNSSTQVQTTSLAIDGRMYFLKTFQVNYNASKSYVSGLQGLSTNPLVLNAGLEKEFFKKRQLVVTFNMYDLLHQNNFVEQTINETGYTNTQSSTLSRYFLVGIRLNFQHWSGTPMRNGRQMQRRGDGSFIY
ncbi:TonB-dependent receptor family protein [Mucilaginibacter sp. HMF5004]|uniref:TonB-dependent receptor n=1 Tax=Mucilaginibacter rivuli TaxID=2857527 RepID=UPI001C5F98B6|nr:TonB-dependent receptor [Mucilaginibacter rivuli]MBW4889124.1 TonB-dependent receptor family protein [Mucilaginibacter rivuli]